MELGVRPVMLGSLQTSRTSKGSRGAHRASHSTQRRRHDSPARTVHDMTYVCTVFCVL